MYLRHPKDFSGVAFDPTEKISGNYTEYVEFLYKRLKLISRTVLDFQAQLQNSQAHKQSQKVKNRRPFSEGMLVYLLAPSASALQTHSKKIRMDFIGPFCISSMLDPTNCILEDLTGRRVLGIYHVNRLKIARLRTSDGCTNSIEKLRKLKSGENDKIDKEKAMFADESGHVLPLNEESLYFIGENNSVNTETVMSHRESNHDMASSTQLSGQQIFSLVQCTDQFPEHGSEWSIERGRFHKGNLQILIGSPKDRAHRIWIDLTLHPNTKDLITDILDKRPIRIAGNYAKYLRDILLIAKEFYSGFNQEHLH